ncbi:MAG: DoxX family protein [Candidatus Marinimicrobia bacterium]|nr:DoxX family protein [Candidatus Neomarinimicrobiota bacterium]
MHVFKSAFEKTGYSTYQLSILVILRVLIGWHFLYEGIAKMLNPNWSSAAFLLESKWIFSGIAESIVASPAVLQGVDFLNIWGLTAIGLGLICGFFTRWAAISGIGLLVIYYLMNPPFIGIEYSMPTEGSYLIVNKNLIELFALWVIVLFPTSEKIGIDRLIAKMFTNSEVE